LYVIHDPRTWGGNTHDTMPEALEDLRRTVKRRIVTDCLQRAAGNAFSRGYMLGKLETDLKWQSADAIGKTKELLRRVQDANVRRRDLDWSRLDAESLEAELQQHRVVERGGNSEDPTSVDLKCTPGMLVFLKRCLVTAATEATIMDKQSVRKTNDDSPTEASL
jgi:hypothetical protein